MEDLVTWLRVQIDEDERVASDAAGWGDTRRHWTREAISCVVCATDGRRLVVYGEGTPTPEEADHIARHDPDRVLCEAQAKRALLEETIRPYLNNGQTTGAIAWQALRLLALSYADQPGYRNEWRP